MKVIILSGIPGSGKSTHARAQRKVTDLGSVIVSADDHLPDDPGPADFGRAHDSCFRDFLDWLMDEEVHTIYVDNTNLTTAEVAPYYLAASSHGAEVSILRIPCDPEVAWNRKRHAVPFKTFCHMVVNFDARNVMPWWQVNEI